MGVRPGNDRPQVAVGDFAYLREIPVRDGNVFLRNESAEYLAGNLYDVSMCNNLVVKR
jgi:hypothetical protein